jgi:methylated-DNA-[protein]-cysteine S-methyltransferase
MSSDRFYHHLFETAFGYVGVVFTGDRGGLKRIFLPMDTRQAAEVLVRPLSTAAPSLPEPIEILCQGVRDYFAAEAVDFDWGLLDLRPLSRLERGVLRAVFGVGYGQTQTYGNIAEQIGRPKAYRFVGTTLANNPFPVVVPCHRIIRADGTLGGFGGGISLKKRMLDIEKEGRRP